MKCMNQVEKFFFFYDSFISKLIASQIDPTSVATTSGLMNNEPVTMRISASPESAAASAVAQGCCAAAEGGWSFNDRLQRRTLPHQTGGFEVVPAARQLIWRECRMQGGDREKGTFKSANQKSDLSKGFIIATVQSQQHACPSDGTLEGLKENITTHFTVFQRKNHGSLLNNF